MMAAIVDTESARAASIIAKVRISNTNEAEDGLEVVAVVAPRAREATILAVASYHSDAQRRNVESKRENQEE